MNSHKFAFAILVLLSFSFAFDVSKYLYEGEGQVEITYENFSSNGETYSLVYLDGMETFLLKDDVPISEKNEMSEVLYDYYKKSYFPSEVEINELKASIEKFNLSRNDGYNWKNKEEYLCRNEILLSNGKISVSGKPVTCKDEKSCEQNAMLLYAAYGEGLGLGSVTPLYDGLVDFSIPSFEMDDILSNYQTKLDNLTEDNLFESIKYIETNADKLEENALKIEKTIFRTPRRDDLDDKEDCYLKCFALCPSFDLDEDAAGDIKKISEDLVKKIEPLSGYQAKTDEIYSRSQGRLNYSINEKTANEYTSKFNSLNEQATRSIGLGEEATLHILNSSLKTKLNELKKLNIDIPGNIEARDFNSIEDEISKYEILINEVDTDSLIILEQYNNTRNAKNIENSLLLLLETKELDPVSSGTLEVLKNKSIDLDAQFRDGITFEQSKRLQNDYQELSESGQQLLKKEIGMPATQVLLLFRGFAKNVNSGIAYAVDESEIIERSEIAENQTFMLGMFSTLLFLSMFSIIVLISLFVLANTKFTIPKSLHIFGATFASALILVLLFSVFTFIYLSKTASDATLEEYLEDFEKGNSTSIVVNLKDTSFADAKAMNECATNLAKTVSDLEKNWTIYRLTPSQCTKVTPTSETILASSDCLKQIESSDSSFELQYSVANEPPKFSIIYDNKAEINANIDYYESCPIVSLFS